MKFQENYNEKLTQVVKSLSVTLSGENARTILDALSTISIMSLAIMYDDHKERIVLAEHFAQSIITGIKDSVNTEEGDKLIKSVGARVKVEDEIL